MPRIRVNRSKTHRRKLSKKGGETPLKFTESDRAISNMEEGVARLKMVAPSASAYPNYDNYAPNDDDGYDPELGNPAKQVNVYAPSAPPPPPPPPPLHDIDEPAGKYQVVSPQYDLYEQNKRVTEVSGSKKGDDWTFFDGIFTGGKKRRTRKNNKRTRKARKSRTNRK